MEVSICGSSSSKASPAPAPASSSSEASSGRNGIMEDAAETKADAQSATSSRNYE